LKTRGEGFLYLAWKSRAAYLFMLPLLFGIVVFKLKPLVEGVRLSFFGQYQTADLHRLR